MAEKMGIAGWSGVIATWVGIGGAGYGGYQALEAYNKEIKQSADASVVQTFALYEMFNRSEMLAVRNRVNDALSLTPDLDDEPEATPAVLPASAAAAPAAAPAAEPDSHVAPADLVVFVDYFDAVQVCVQRELCDADLVDRLIKPYAIFDSLKDDIAKVRDDEKELKLKHEFGAGIEWLDKTDLQALGKKSG